jgi:GDPmannose 4,6-dehydratase
MKENELINQRALILGVNGQDGSLLAEALIRKKFVVIGVGRQPKFRNELAVKLDRYIQLDISAISKLNNLLVEVRADVIFHTAAIHGPAGFDYESNWQEVHLVNTLSLQALLVYAVDFNPNVQIFYFSSSKCFGELANRSITEETLRISECLYSTSKNSSTALIQIYRKKYKIRASTIWLFNHESSRRQDGYFSSKIIDALARSILDPSYKLSVSSLDFWCDWGDAEEYMELIASSLSCLAGHDIVLATGKTVWANDMVHELFSRYNLIASDHLIVQQQIGLPDSMAWFANTAKLEMLINKKPLLSGAEVFDKLYKDHLQGSH